MRLINVFGLILLASIALPALALTPVTGMGNGSRVTGGLLLQDTSYEDVFNFDIETTQLMLAYKTAINSKFALGVGLGLVIDGELADNIEADDGKGFRLTADGQFTLKEFGTNEILLVFGLNHDRYGFERRAFNTTTNYDFVTTDLWIGGLFVHHIQSVSLYGGLQAYLYSNGELEFNNFQRDVERDDIINIRLGASFSVDRSIDLRADLLLVGEQTLMLAGDFKL